MRHFENILHTSISAKSLFHCVLRELDWVQLVNPVESWLDVKMYNFMQEAADQK